MLNNMTQFYLFVQNNSGGQFIVDETEGIGEYVIIEAYSSVEANDIAEKKGIYFNGCDDGVDCSCCGDRWHQVDDSDADDVPSIYGTPVQEATKSYARSVVYIHYLNGHIEKVTLKDHV